MKVYLIGSANLAELEAEWDDPSVRDWGLADLATPTFGRVLKELPDSSSEYFEVVKDEALEMHELTDTSLEEELPKLTWRGPEHKLATSVSRAPESWTWHLVDEDDEEVAAVVVLAVEVE